MPHGHVLFNIKIMAHCPVDKHRDKELAKEKKKKEKHSFGEKVRMGKEEKDTQILKLFLT